MQSAPQLRNSCEQCRKRKVKCSGAFPCKRCVDLGHSHECHYARKVKTGRPKLRKGKAAARGGSKGAPGAPPAKRARSDGSDEEEVPDEGEIFANVTEEQMRCARYEFMSASRSQLPFKLSVPEAEQIVGEEPTIPNMAKAVVTSQELGYHPPPMLPQGLSNIDKIPTDVKQKMVERFMRSSALTAIMFPRLRTDQTALTPKDLGTIHRMILLASIATIARVESLPLVDDMNRRGERLVLEARVAAAETELRLLAQGYYGVFTIAAGFAQFLLAWYFIPTNQALSRMYASSLLQVTVEIASNYMDGSEDVPSDKYLRDLIFLRKAAFMIQVGFTVTVGSASSFTSRNLTEMYSDMVPLLNQETLAYTKMTVQHQMSRSRLKTAIQRQWDANRAMDMTRLNLSRDEAIRGFEIANMFVQSCAVVSPVLTVPLDVLAKADTDAHVSTIFGLSILDSTVLMTRGVYQAALGDMTAALEAADLIYDGCMRHLEADIAIEAVCVELLHFLICVFCRFENKLDRAAKCIHLLRTVSLSSPTFRRILTHDQDLYERALGEAKNLSRATHQSHYRMQAQVVDASEQQMQQQQLNFDGLSFDNIQLSGVSVQSWSVSDGNDPLALTRPPSLTPLSSARIASELLGPDDAAERFAAVDSMSYSTTTSYASRTKAERGPAAVVPQYAATSSPSIPSPSDDSESLGLSYTPPSPAPSPGFGIRNVAEHDDGITVPFTPWETLMAQNATSPVLDFWDSGSIHTA